MAAEYDGTTRSGKQIEPERWESILRALLITVSTVSTHWMFAILPCYCLPPCGWFIGSRPSTGSGLTAAAMLLKFRGLRESQWTAPARLLHHFQFRDSWDSLPSSDG